MTRAVFVFGILFVACTKPADVADAATPAPSAAVAPSPSGSASASAAPSASAAAPSASAAPGASSVSTAKPIGTAYDAGRFHICVPDTWTQGNTAFAGPPRCGTVPTRRIWDGDVHRPCGPCAFTFDAAVTKRERAMHVNACCFRGASPGGHEP